MKNVSWLSTVVVAVVCCGAPRDPIGDKQPAAGGSIGAQFFADSFPVMSPHPSFTSRKCLLSRLRLKVKEGLEPGRKYTGVPIEGTGRRRTCTPVGCMYANVELRCPRPFEEPVLRCARLGDFEHEADLAGASYRWAEAFSTVRCLASRDEASACFQVDIGDPERRRCCNR
ncbi:uncharacterized protein ColSpa_09464 [Colletotrichum spaethianum]|uniref:Secreted protein n=1 Tax=Colletotrichum spaethianum TaxID=700344 RepID=A0AA37PBL7_9PEZI|nr:uncharacterized protein ColSpa_09464 [Colletotrichum spaethianum]GKT49283.1 hypothetical protein ColSpa_09464 [Colletotrichum spaethianum]